jgi:hypothetical protein
MSLDRPASTRARFRQNVGRTLTERAAALRTVLAASLSHGRPTLDCADIRRAVLWHGQYRDGHGAQSRPRSRFPSAGVTGSDGSSHDR